MQVVRLGAALFKHFGREWVVFGVHAALLVSRLFGLPLLPGFLEQRKEGCSRKTSFSLAYSLSLANRRPVLTDTKVERSRLNVPVLVGRDTVPLRGVLVDIQALRLPSPFARRIVQFADRHFGIPDQAVRGEGWSLARRPPCRA